MDRATAIQQIKQACNDISAQLMKIHPAVPSLADKPLQDELHQVLFRLTKEVETVKKRVLRLEAGDADVAEKV